MPINLVSPTCLTTGILVADSVSVAGGSPDGVPTITKVGGVPIAAALEVQSTLGAFVLPRMTTAQKTALSANLTVKQLVPGMQVFDTDLNAVSTYANGGWSTGASQEANLALTAANITGMNGAAIQVIAAPGAGKIIIVNKFFISFTAGGVAFTGGGTGIALQYAAGVYNAADLASELISAATITTNTNNFASGIGHSLGATALTTANATNAPIYITSQGAFAAGNGTANLKVWYTIINAF